MLSQVIGAGLAGRSRGLIGGVMCAGAGNRVDLRARRWSRRRLVRGVLDGGCAELAGCGDVGCGRPRR